MNNRTTILILSAVLIAAMLSGCVRENSEIESPDVSPTATVSEVTSPSMSPPPHIKNWEYVSYRNLSISNAPALNQTARITYSIVPDEDIEVLFVYITIDGFEFVDVEGERILKRGTIPFDDLDRRAVWYPTNLSKGEIYQFNATIKAVKTGNFTIRHCGGNEVIYISVFEDSAYWYMSRPEPLRVQETLRGNCINKSEQLVAPPETFPFHYLWNGTVWIEVESPPKSMVRPYWNGTTWVERKNQS
ncbi:MAG: hypothetical protein C5S48_09275 [Candidatus Methanogaster sp.]|nr:MAG: hypothetical protein C5S48_09275 [ANME-2 cluster archaeon]